MKKYIAALIFVLALSLALCAGAAEAQPSLSGALGDGDQLSWQVEAGTLSIRGDQPWTGTVIAGYYRDGRLIRAKVPTPGNPTVTIDDRTTFIKLFWLDSNRAPKCRPVKISLAPDKVICDGITSWDDLTTPGTDHYVAPDFAQDCDYFFNDMFSSPVELRRTVNRRGTVVEFYTNIDGQISVVKAYQYTVDLVESGDAKTKVLSNGTVQVRVPGVINSYTDVDKVIGWQGLVEGDVVLKYKTALPNSSYHYILEKAEKITGNVSDFSAADGTLTINGSAYYASEQPASGTVGDVWFDDTGSQNGEYVFSNWTDVYNLVDQYDFYLDKSGAIVAAIQITESIYSPRLCLIVKTQVTDSGLGASLLFMDGSTETVPVSKIGVYDAQDQKIIIKTLVDNVTDLDRQISMTAARDALTGDAEDRDATARFFSCRYVSDGYELAELNAASGSRRWENSVSLGNGTDKVATIMQMSAFAKNSQNLAVWDILAYSGTTFLVDKRGADGVVNCSVYKGFRSLPEIDATRMTAICPNDGFIGVNLVAEYVYILQE